jgi:hypothetical protein
MPIAFGMGALGALLGVWIVLSKSAIVITVLPLLFGLIGGAGGYSLLKMDLSKPANQGKVKLIGVALGALSSSCLIFMVMTIISRPSLERLINEPGFDISKSQTPVRSLVMRARLQALGATEGEMRRILEPTQATTSNNVATQLPAVVAAAETYIGAYDALSSEDRAVLESDRARDDSRTVYVASRVFVLKHQALAPKGAPVNTQTTNLLLENIESLASDSQPSSSAKEVQEVLLKNANFMIAKVKLAYAVEQVRAARETLASARTNEITEIDETLRVLANVTAKETPLRAPYSSRIAMGGPGDRVSF